MGGRFPKWFANFFIARDEKSGHGTRGQLLPLYALGATALLGMGALALDAGYFRYQQRLEQTAADSAAIAGAIELIYTSASVTTFARTDAATNGYTNGAAGTTVTVNTPPATGPYAASAHAVEVIVTKNQPLFFGGVFGGVTVPISARAVARNDAPNAGSGCVVTLGGALTINGGAGGFLAPTCGVIADGGMTINGNGTVTAQYIGVATGTVPSCGGCTEAIPARSVAAPDPCPAITSCEFLAATPPITGLTKNPATTTLNGKTYYHPGEYTSTFSPNTAILAPGLYVLDNGMSANGNDTITVNTAVAPGGVTLYNKAGAISFKGNSSIDLPAPTSGSYAGMSIYQPLSNTSADTISGGGTYGVGGMIYAPGADVTLNGSDPAVSQLVVASMTVNGGGITVDNTGTGNPNNELGIPHVVLAE